MTANISSRINELKVLMTLFIVLLHTMVHDERMWPLRPMVNVAVPVFFVISSYLYFQNWNPSISCYWKKMKSRIKSIYVPFVFYNALFVPYIILKTNVLHLTDDRNIAFLSTDMFFSVFFGCPFFPNSVVWYLMAVLLFSAFAPLIGLLITKTPKYLQCIIAIIVLIASSRFAYISVFYWLPCLMLGAWLAFHEKYCLKMTYELKKRKKWLGISFLAFLLAFLAVSAIILRHENVFTSSYYYSFRMSVGLIFLSVFWGKSILPQNVTCLFLPYMLPVYCLHVVFVNMTMLTIQHFCPSLHFVAAQLLTFTISIIAVLSLCIFLSRIKPLWRIMTGLR